MVVTLDKPNLQFEKTWQLNAYLPEASSSPMQPQGDSLEWLKPPVLDEVRCLKHQL